jgi:pimeloyl-ACP methyl ester carboxylesterase
VARTGLHTVPASSVRQEAAGIRVPTLLVVGVRETGFDQARKFAEETIPGLRVVALDGGHAVNAEAAAEFNGAVIEFIKRLVGHPSPAL